MALGIPVSCGSTSDTDDQASYTHNTTATVPSGALLVVTAMWGGTGGAVTPTLSGGGLSWATDKDQTITDGSNTFNVACFSAPAPSGLASSTTLTLSLSPDTALFGAIMEAFYIEGTSGVVNMTDGQGRSSPTSAWDSTATSTTVADTILIGAACYDSGSAITSTATGGGSELFDVTSAENFGLTTTYEIVASAASQNAQGNWSSTPDTDAALVVAYEEGSFTPWPPPGSEDSPRTIIQGSAPRLR